MSDYREELLNSVDTQSSELTKGVSQIDVTSSGNYAATWMEQDGGKSAIDRAAEAELAMADILRTFQSNFEHTGLAPKVETITDEDGQYQSVTVPRWFKGDDSFSLGEAGLEDIEYDQPGIDGYFEDYLSQGGSQETVDKAKQSMLYQALDSTEDFYERKERQYNERLAAEEAELAAEQAEVASAPEPQGRPIGDLSALEESVAQANQSPSPQETPKGKQDREFGPQQQTKTQQEVQSRREALKARQERAMQSATALDVGDGEANENRQPNFRAGANAMNASVNDFATTVADQFVSQAQALTMATARIRALEKIIREASR